MTEVKTPRAYNSAGRRESAARARERILVTAEELFLSLGYAQTTVAAIARASGVSVETVYKAWGNKTGILAALRIRALAGGGEVAAEERSDAMREATTTAGEVIDGWARLQVEVMPRVAPILLLVRDAAATSPEAQRLDDEVSADRMTRMLHHSEFLSHRGQLRAGLTVQRAADVMFAYTAPEFYEILVLGQRWDPNEYGAFIARALKAGLLP
ncbi:TetR/AcrR family transcriptional regulator [Glaciibacter sp. 2TAF33]|uniref:TetR/AcrR family transcriptional regulator n=1 Tax=Glaciibacter sp. 2TAF33 TaxID=3233015 RepID=UPI003F8F083F